MRLGIFRFSLALLVVFGASAGTVRAAGAPEPFYWTPETDRVEGAFGRNLYVSLASVIPDSVLDTRERTQMAWELADLFRWQSDFSHDFRMGDHFAIVFERLRSQFGEVRFGRVLAADLVVGGKPLTAFEFDDPEGKTAYYDEQGNSMRRSFLRVPVEFKRISSGFGMRFHPILAKWRGHEGIDYAAAPGSPVMAVADGVVLRAGWFGGYGRLVEIQHAGGVTTRYGHLKSFPRGIRPGQHVGQGDCIGYVGATGLATGPHLHFEFRIHNVATDPRLVQEEDAQAAPVTDSLGFGQEVARLRALLDTRALVLASRSS